MSLLEHAAALCKHLEPRLREIGWHIGLTGSALYGKLNTSKGPRRLGHSEEKENQSDIDLILYPNNDGVRHDETCIELFQAMGIKKYHVLLNNTPEAGEYTREVIRARLKDGTQVDFFLLEDWEDRIPGI